MAKKSSSFSVTFLFRGFDGDSNLFSVDRGGTWSSWLGLVVVEHGDVRRVEDWIVRNSEQSLKVCWWLGYKHGLGCLDCGLMSGMLAPLWALGPLAPK